MLTLTRAVALCAAAFVLHAQEAPKDPPPTPAPRPKVVAANKSAKTTISAEVGDSVTLAVDGLAEWLKQNPTDSAKWRLYLDDREMPGIAPYRVDVTNGILQFQLRMPQGEETTPAIKAAWTYVLTRAMRDERLSISFGPQDARDPFLSDAARFSLMVRTKTFWIAAAFVLFTVGAMFWLGKRSDLLRESTADPIPPGKRACFSLSRCQMAWWFVLVIGAYLYLFALTTSPPVITTTVLALIGISAATGLSAAVVDWSKRDEDLKMRRDLQAESIALTTRIQALRTELSPASPPLALNTEELTKELQTKEARLAELKGKIQVLPPPGSAPISSGNFLLDLLRDNQSVSFHRFQIFVWTIVLGIVFVRTVARDLMMPDFDGTLLGLMGISSGTYLGFKFPDKPKPTTTP